MVKTYFGKTLNPVIGKSPGGFDREKTRKTNIFLVLHNYCHYFFEGLKSGG
jgi:hypothetical protein